MLDEAFADGVATLTFNDPATRNALSMDLRAALFKAVDRVAADDAVRCVVIQGAGGAFMSGGDIRSFRDSLALDRETRADHYRARIRGLSGMVATLMSMPKPVVASVSGPAAGAGLSLMLACDLAIGDETAWFSMAYSRLGLSPDGGGSWLLPRLLGTRKAMELAMLGDRVEAAEALRLGLLNRVVPEGALEAETEALARRLASGPTQAYAKTKRLLHAAHDRSAAAHMIEEGDSFARLTGTDDWEGAVQAFLDKRPIQFEGH